MSILFSSNVSFCPYRAKLSKVKGHTKEHALLTLIQLLLSLVQALWTGDGWKLSTHQCPQLEHVCCACCASVTANRGWSWYTPVATAEAFDVGEKTHSIILYIDLYSVKVSMLTNSDVYNETALGFWDIDFVCTTVRLLHWGDPQCHDPFAQVFMDEGRPVYVLIHLVVRMVVSMSICMHHTFVASSLHIHGVGR